VVRGNHSTGALYMTLSNNPREIRFLREETILLTLIPGPFEHTLKGLNKVLLPFVLSMQRLYNGM
jgi:hypothetical protein